jgi:hypothetical protein
VNASGVWYLSAVYDTDVATDSKALRTRIRKANRSRASGSLMPGEYKGEPHAGERRNRKLRPVRKRSTIAERGGTNGPADEEYPRTGSTPRDLFAHYLDTRGCASGHGAS